MYFDDNSCHVQTTLQKTKALGVYDLIKSDWAGIVIVMKQSHRIIIEEGHFDFSNIGLEFILEVLSRHAAEVAGMEEPVIIQNGYELMVLPIRKERRYEVFTVNFKREAFDANAMAWMRSYNTIFYENVLLRNEIAQEKSCIENIFESTTAAIMNIDLDGNIVAANPPSVEMFSLGDLLAPVNIKHIECINEIWPIAHQRALLEQKYSLKNFPYTSGDETKFLNLIFSPIKSSKEQVLGVVMTCSDETNKLLMERGIEQLKQFAVLGEVATGVAHDVRNPLMNIRCSMRLLDKTMAAYSPVHELLDDIVREVDRIDNVVEQLLTYCDISQNSLYSFIDINESIQQSTTVIQRSLNGKYIELQTELDSAIPIISGNKTELQQAILNVLFNAIQAIPVKGVVSIKSQLNRANNTICISVRDNGIGIPYEMQDKIFNHFVSTKPDGVGFGLSIVKRAVSNHGGTLLLESVPEKGTSVFIYLPCERNDQQEPDAVQAHSHLFPQAH